MNKNQRKIYFDHISPATDFADSLLNLMTLYNVFSCNPGCAELLYELEKSKNYFSTDWEE